MTDDDYDNDTDYGIEPDQGWVTVYGLCALCRKMIGFHPHHVPSIVVNGAREPICEPCFRRVQEAQRQQGVPVTPDPPPDAYDGMPASEL